MTRQRDCAKVPTRVMMDPTIDLEILAAELQRLERCLNVARENQWQDLVDNILIDVATIFLPLLQYAQTFATDEEERSTLEGYVMRMQEIVGRLQ